MSIKELHVSGYRSVRDVSLPLGRLTVLVGPNGCGKTNLYRALSLLGRAAAGQLSHALAEEGGMPSALWAGERKKNERAQVRIAVTLDQLSYEVILGVPTPFLGINNQPSAFVLDPEVKEERICFRDGKRRTALFERNHGSATARNEEGQRVSYALELDRNESVLSQIRDPHRYPGIVSLWQEFLSWRFYHQFRTDAASPLRQPQMGIRTPVLSHDGHDLAAALQTILECGDSDTLCAAIQHAFPGSQLSISTEPSRFLVQLQMPPFRRMFTAAELSDGTLHYLCLLAVLLSLRPPSLLALNEPETSIHPDLLGPLAQLLVDAAERSQLWVTTHSEKLAAEIERRSGTKPLRLSRVDGQTQLA